MIPAIDKNIPPPRDKRGPEPKYPFEHLQVGDSFFVKDGIANRLSGAASHWRKVTGRQYRVRTVDGGIRVWRIA